ncbi:LysR substrate-binding domain-containing protein [Pseudomonas kermanshahensis]|uniref:LysR substrate-binding domain-containing protein n=1 Tax=Pseudomonas kermanshahensis TaxID=2745482 RepID=UPI003BB581FB
MVSEHLREGQLVEVLADWQPASVPVHLLYPHQRFLSPAVSAFADWIAGLATAIQPACQPMCRQRRVRL